jgi:hypothetical protein
MLFLAALIQERGDEDIRYPESSDEHSSSHVL